MVSKLLAEKAYLPVLKMNDGSAVTANTWGIRRQELLEVLQSYSYGFTPPEPKRVWGRILREDPAAYAGKVLEQQAELSFETERGVCSFPVSLYIPVKAEKPNARKWVIAWAVTYLVIVAAYGVWMFVEWKFKGTLIALVPSVLAVQLINLAFRLGLLFVIAYFIRKICRK